MSDARDTYERLRPLIVWLGLTELAWISYWLLSGDNSTATFEGFVFAWIIVMLGWLGLVIYAGSREFFLKHSQHLSNLVAVVIVVTFTVATFGLVPAARQGLLDAAHGTSDLQLISIHILRLLAIGGIIKYLHRELPLHFTIMGAVPDFLFGVSAVVLVTFGPPSHVWLVVWHVVGFLVFFGAGISMFFSVPSPFHIYDSKPDASIVFRFPMVLAPTFTVPLFMIAHLFALTKLLAT
ncbi:MAG TPA: hypothetical protein EYG03_12050 [Planctomycetes bacterium]|nr:hypothetical protein [Fuerstiella sp.]HIK92699.1 hypothetical protein [Planctomycetota bacterium]